MAVFLGAVLAVRGGFRPQALGGFKDALWILASEVAGALSWLFYFAALQRGPASAIVALDRTSVIFAIVFAGLFLAELLTRRTILGAALVAAGALLFAWR